MRRLLSAVVITLSLGVAATTYGQEADVSAGQDTDASAPTLADGMAARRSEDYSTALSIFQTLADQGDASSQLSLGGMYARGQGVEQDDAEAMRWYRLAADQGSALAQHRVGANYLVGRGVQMDEAEAARWFRMAAERGHEDAQTSLGSAYATGQGVPQDNVRAYMWFTVAMEAVSPAAAARGRATGRRASRVSRARTMATRWTRLRYMRDSNVPNATPQQIAEAEAMATRCVESDFQDCD